MIWFTGDTHGDLKRFSSKNCPLTAGDTVIICGDFGCIWEYTGESTSERWWLNWLETKPYTICFVDGNHENFDRLNAFPEEMWCGGRVHKIRPNVIHLMRGQIFTIEGKTIFTMGGAPSHDIKDGIIDGTNPNWKEKLKIADKQRKMVRVSGVSWWEQEMPTAAEYGEAEVNLLNNAFTVDYVVTHEAPSAILGKLYDSLWENVYNELSDWLNQVYRVADFKHWYCGHHHINKTMGDNFTILYEAIVSEG